MILPCVGVSLPLRPLEQVMETQTWITSSSKYSVVSVYANERVDAAPCDVVEQSTQTLWEVQGCTSTFWEVRGCTRTLWEVRVCTRTLGEVRGCARTLWEVRGCARRLWEVRGCARTLWEVRVCTIHLRPIIEMVLILIFHAIQVCCHMYLCKVGVVIYQ